MYIITKEPIANNNRYMKVQIKKLKTNVEYTTTSKHSKDTLPVVLFLVERDRQACFVKL